MPVMAYIQDKRSRLTLHTAQALGVSSLSSGECRAAAMRLVPWGSASLRSLARRRKPVLQSQSPRRCRHWVPAAPALGAWLGRGCCPMALGWELLCSGPAADPSGPRAEAGRAARACCHRPALPALAGQLEVILDRRLVQDDNRGLGQGLKDNKRTWSRFRLLLERRTTANKVRGSWGRGGGNPAGPGPGEAGLRREGGSISAAQVPSPPCTQRCTPCTGLRGSGAGAWGGAQLAVSGPGAGWLLVTWLFSSRPAASHPYPDPQRSGFLSKLASVFRDLAALGTSAGSQEVTGACPCPAPVPCASRWYP